MNITIHREGKNYGPYSLEQVKAYLSSGSLLANDLAWHEGAATWLPLSQVPDLVALLPPVSAQTGVPPLPSGLSEVSLLQQTEFTLLPDEEVYMDGWVHYRRGWDHRAYCYVTNHRLSVIQAPSHSVGISGPGLIIRALTDFALSANLMEKPTKIKYQIPWTNLTEISRPRGLFLDKIFKSRRLIFKSSDGLTVKLAFNNFMLIPSKETPWHCAIRKATMFRGLPDY
jgi:hypothetical protein